MTQHCSWRHMFLVSRWLNLVQRQRGKGSEATGVTTGLGKGHNGKEMLWGGEGHWEVGMRMRGSVPGGRENEG